MEYYNSGLEEKLSEAFSVIMQCFRELWNALKPYAEEIEKFIGELEMAGHTKKIRHKPVLNITANKTFIPNKRLNVYYCRDIC